MSHSGPDGGNSLESATLRAERCRGSFDVEAMSSLWLGSSEAVRAKDRAVQHIAKFPLYDRADVWRQSKYERYVRASERITSWWAHETSAELRELTPKEQMACAQLALRDNIVGINEGMFIPTIRLQGSDEQRDLWIPAATSHAILGTYCQTEIGHGSDVQGLETQATYVKETQEFEIHTPGERATKWWPQGLGRTVTHAVVYARLRIPRGDGSVEDKGPRAFLVQLRDLETHENLPGIRSGDIGPTFGVVASEQGWCEFHRVRVPRSAMLCRYGEVLEDGSYKANGGAGAEKRGYSTMMMVRSMFVQASADYLGRGCAIAVRYCAVRRQFPKETGAPRSQDGREGREECQVLDYQGVQMRTLPWIATAFALRFTGRKMTTIYQESEARALRGDLLEVAQAHALSSGFKAACTKLAADGIEELRRACGGHGYSQLAGLGELYGDCMLMFTGEGENYMIIQQLTRWLLKGEFGTGWAAFLASSSPSPSSSSSASSSCSTSSSSSSASSWSSAGGSGGLTGGGVRGREGWLATAAQVAALKHRAQARVDDLRKQLGSAVASGVSRAAAASSTQWDGIEASFAVCDALIADAFAEGVAMAEPGLQQVLSNLCSLFCLNLLERHAADLLLDSYITAPQLQDLRACVRDLLSAIRPEAVALVDSFRYWDGELNSAIGAHDGDVYRRLLRWAAEEPMNEGSVIKGWHEHWKPAMDAARRRLASSSGLSLADRGLVQQKKTPGGQKSKL